MKKIWQKSAVLTLAVLGMASAKVNSTPGRVPDASDSQLNSDAQCVSVVPRSWGQYRGGSSQSGLAFEASDGTLRFVTNLPCGAVPAIALEVRRTSAVSSNSQE